MAKAKNPKIMFTGHSGNKLAALLDLPAGKPHGYALFAHCFTCSKDIHAAARISAGLAEKGFAVLRFDFTGLGHSAGEFANTNFSSNIADLIKAADFLREEYEAPALLVGHSLGGAAILAAAKDVPECKAVATIGAPASAEHVLHNFKASLDTIREKGEAEVELAGRKFRIQEQFVEDATEQNLIQEIGQLGKALMIFHSPRDVIVDVDQARRIYEAAIHPKSFVSLDDADHLLTKPADAAYVADILSAWVKRYLELPEDRPEALPSGVIEVAETGTGKFTQTVRLGRHQLIADEPETYGGDDAGPSPYDYLLAGLGACTSMTMRLYAEQKGLDLRHVNVRLKHDRIHAKDCETCQEKEGKIDHIERRITLEGDLSVDERTKLLEIAEKCPVHRTLHSEVEVNTELSV